MNISERKMRALTEVQSALLHRHVYILDPNQQSAPYTRLSEWNTQALTGIRFSLNRQAQRRQVPEPYSPKLRAHVWLKAMTAAHWNGGYCCSAHVACSQPLRSRV